MVTKQVTPNGSAWSTTTDLTSLDDGALVCTAAATDLAGNSGTATASGITGKDLAAPTVKSVKLANGGSTNASQPSADKSDTVTLTFSEPMDLTKFCPNWTTSKLSGTATITDTGAASHALVVKFGNSPNNGSGAGTLLS